MLTADEQKFLDMINKFRADSKADPLKANENLFTHAREQAANSAKKEPKPLPPDKLGYRQIFTLTHSGADLSPQQLYDGWMQSNVTRVVLLERYQDIGIGSARSADGVVHYLVIFAGDPS